MLDSMDSLFPEFTATAALLLPAEPPMPTPATEVPTARKRTPKLFYKINEVAQLTGLKPHVLRYWETEFRELAPAKDASDQRRYRKGDIEVVQTIRKLLYEERYTIEGARKRLRAELNRARQSAGGRAPRSAKAAPAAQQPQAPKAAPAAAMGRGELSGSLKRLRSEVNELLKILGA